MVHTSKSCLISESHALLITYGFQPKVGEISPSSNFANPWENRWNDSLHFFRLVREEAEQNSFPVAEMHYLCLVYSFQPLHIHLTTMPQNY